MAVRLGVVRGNGIGPEITEAALCVLESTRLEFKFEPVSIGSDGMEKYGMPLSQEAVAQLKDLKLAIKAPLLVEKFQGRLYCEHEDGSVGVYPSLNNAIRRELGLFICPRPIRGVPGLSGKYAKLNIHIMREITEDVYSGIEHMIGDDEAAECTKLTTRKAAVRAAEYAFQYARRYGHKKVSCVHKANAISMADGLFLRCFRETAEKYPDIVSDDYMVDAAAYLLAKDPGKFDVLLGSNQYGDILSYLAAGLAGSLGLAPGINIGPGGLAIAEASHGAAPDIAGQGIADPVALILSSAILLKESDHLKEAEAIEKAVFAVLEEGKVLPPDLGGKAGTMEIAEVIAGRVPEYL